MDTTFVLRNPEELTDLAEILKVLFKSSPTLRLDVSPVDESWLDDYPAGEAYLEMLKQRAAEMNAKSSVLMDDGGLNQ